MSRVRQGIFRRARRHKGLAENGLFAIVLYVILLSVALHPVSRPSQAPLK